MKTNIKVLVSMDPDPDYLVCKKEDGLLLQIGDPFWGMSAAREEIRALKALDSSWEFVVVKETRKRKIFK